MSRSLLGFGGCRLRPVDGGVVVQGASLPKMRLWENRSSRRAAGAFLQWDLRQGNSYWGYLTKILLGSEVLESRPGGWSKEGLVLVGVILITVLQCFWVS